MNQIESLAKTIDVLKSFNNTVVTSRIYPPEAPQVTAAVDRGYKSIKAYLRACGSLSFTLHEGMPCLCDIMLSRETLDSFSNLVVYRQLRLLGLNQLAISAEMDRFAFSQLLLVLNASVEKIKNEGGGLAYITSLGLAGYFPETTGVLVETKASKCHADGPRSRNMLKIRPEIIACLFGRDKRPVLEDELRKKMSILATAVDTLAAGTAHILQDIQKRKMIVASRYFPFMLARAEALIEPDLRQEVAQGLAALYVESLKDPALCVLSAQQYPAGFGTAVHDALLEALTPEKLSSIIHFLREQLIKAGRDGGEESLQAQFLDKVLTSLVSSKKGQHFLSTEKVKNLIDDGERARKKRRLEAGIKGFLQGNISLLKSEELVAYLPIALRQLQKNNDNVHVSLLLHGMVAYLAEGTEVPQESLSASMVIIGEKLLADGEWSHLDLLVKPLIAHVRQARSTTESIEKIITFLQQVMQQSWQVGENERGDALLTFLHQLRSGRTPHAAVLQSVVARIQDRGIRRSSLPELLKQCLAAPQDEKLSFRLLHQGPIVVRFLVESLINAEKAADRLKIIDLLTVSPENVPTLVHERLQEHMLWYGKRNLIKLLGETGTDKDAESILPYLQHEDFRVQREAFLALYKIGGKNRKQLLLHALDAASEHIMVQIIASLGIFCDAVVVDKLALLTASHEQFSDSNRNELLLQLMETLGRCPCPEAYACVSAFLESRGQRGTKKIAETVWAAAEKSIIFLQKDLQESRKKHVQASQLRKIALKQAAKANKTPLTQWVITGSPEEQAVRTLLVRGEKKAAVEQVMGLIERAARQRNFMQAQKLREWLVEIDSTALSQILRATEIIDHEKVAAIDKGHLEIWSELYDILHTDEFSALFYSLKHKKYHNGEIIVHQGTVQETLFFINSGEVKVYFADKGNEVLVKTMGKGQIFGAEAFFEASVSTISVAAIGTAEISILKLDSLQQWRRDSPGLEAKLYNFCQKFQTVEDFIKLSESDRRLYQRYRISGRVIATLVDARGRSLGTDFKVDLADISEGGLSFQVRIAQQIDGRLLLGRKMQFLLPVRDTSGEDLAVIGDVLAVKRNIGVDNEYFLHLRFTVLLDRHIIHDIVMAMRQEPQVMQ